MVLNNDNDESREIIEACYRFRKTVLNPIIEWSDEDVWEFIRTYHVRYCELYDKGYARLGCIGCPMNTTAAAAELEAYPKYKEAYIRAFQRMVEARAAKGLTVDEAWTDGEAVMEWWLGKTRSKQIDGQIEMEIKSD